MADADSVIKPKHLLGEKTQKDPSKFTSHFMFKALVVAIFLVVIQNFPSQAPEFINQTLLTRGWELVHLLFVGIAISYGLFSRKSDETEKEKEAHHSKFDNAQSYVSRFLQVSSVFDDENENSSGSEQETKIQTWSSQYYRNEPAVVVAQESSVLDDHKVTSSRNGEKPLLLPVRSLKSRVLDADKSPRDSSNSPVFLGRSSSNSGSKRFSRNSSLNLSKNRNDEFVGDDLEEYVKQTVVLPSPIPWRSRSGREDMKNPPFFHMPPSTEESDFSKSFKSPVPRLSRPNSTNSSPKFSPTPSLSSPKKISPSPSMSLESQASTEDLMRKRSYYKTSSPPPAPPPPPPMIRKSSSMKPSSVSMADGISFEKELRRSFTSDVGRENRWRANLGVEAKPRIYNDKDGSSMGKSVRTYRNGESHVGAWKGDAENGLINGKMEKMGKTVERSSAREKAGRKTVAFDKNAYWSHESGYISPRPTFIEFPMDEKREYVDKVIVQSDWETDNEDEDANGGQHENEEADSSNLSDEAPDVDKKADEFIAKFREQIRLQRIESIKRTSAEISRSTSR